MESEKSCENKISKSILEMLPGYKIPLSKKPKRMLRFF